MTRHGHKPRRDLRSIRVTPRDVATVSWIAEQYAVRIDHLAILLHVGARTAYDWRARMARQQWIEGQILYGRLWLWPTAAGMTACGLEFPARPPVMTHLNHLAGINLTRLWYATHRPETIWVAERRLRQRFTPGQNASHVPDGVIWEGSQATAIEVELRSKGEAQTRAILTALLSAGYQRIVYVCSSTTAGIVERSVQAERLDADQVAIWTLDRLADEVRQHALDAARRRARRPRSF